MNPYVISSLVIGGIFLGGCKSSMDFPPSKFIGFYESYNGYKNGTLPSRQNDYSGIWTSQDGLLIGRYKSGVPSGEWLKYYSNRRLESVMVFYENGIYQRRDWYPDGTLMSQSTGTYHCSTGEMRYTLREQQNWNWYGNKIKLGAPSTDSVFRYIQEIPSIPHGMVDSAPEYEVKCFCTIVGNHFEIALYLWNRQEALLPMQRLFISGSCDFNYNVTIKQPQNQNENALRFSDYSIKGKILNLNFFAPGEFASNNKITIQLYLK